MKEEPYVAVNLEEARGLLKVGEELLREYVRLLLEENARARLVGPTRGASVRPKDCLLC